MTAPRLEGELVRGEGWMEGADAQQKHSMRA
jgi:hypothetical protein